ncbi:unnamed protein product [Mesocestoides corti]|uniref:Dihydropteridine reductase n=1 Tax=Mesocestoides corti TaxID=53468 RepID=A0A0R3U2I9_MESCO|nr:unnamed protein product [Mesocestoides corti]
MSSRVIVYGGNGALGSACVSFFKNKGLWVCSIGSQKNSEADANVILTNREVLEEQHREVQEGVKNVLDGVPVDGIFCTAGGWAGGKCTAKGFVRSVDSVVKQSIWPSTIAASLCPNYLRPGGSLILSGWLSALHSTPGMIGYGLAKAAVHHMTSSLADADSGMPPNSFVAAILPNILDTPRNRKWMPNADQSTLFFDWLLGKGRPKSGSLVKLVTEGGKTESIVVNTP